MQRAKFLFLQGHFAITIQHNNFLHLLVRLINLDKLRIMRRMKQWTKDIYVIKANTSQFLKTAIYYQVLFLNNKITKAFPELSNIPPQTFSTEKGTGLTVCPQ